MAAWCRRGADETLFVARAVVEEFQEVAFTPENLDTVKHLLETIYTQVETSTVLVSEIICLIANRFQVGIPVEKAATPRQLKKSTFSKS